MSEPLLVVDEYFEEVSAGLLAPYEELLDDKSLMELVFFVATALLLLDGEADSEMFPNFGLDSASLFSFCCFQLGVFKLGAFSSNLSNALAGAAGTCFFHEGRGFSGVDGAELSGVALEGTFHDGVDVVFGPLGESASGFELCVVVLLLVDEVA